jgi:hypothetical protein
VSGVKDHELRELVDRLRDIAVRHHDSQQLRTLIANCVKPFFRDAQETHQDSKSLPPLS